MTKTADRLIYGGVKAIIGHNGKECVLVAAVLRSADSRSPALIGEYLDPTLTINQSQVTTIHRR